MFVHPALHLIVISAVIVSQCSFGTVKMPKRRCLRQIAYLVAYWISYL